MIPRKETDPKARQLKLYQQCYHDFRVGKKQRKIANQTHVSKSDADASLVSRNSSYSKLCYKVHYTLDNLNRIIVDCHSTSGACHECKVFPDRVNYILKNFGYKVQEWITDKGYGRGPTYNLLKSYKIQAYVPLHKKNMGNGKLNAGEFIYEKEQDRYRCPAGHYLYAYTKLEHNSIKRYRMVGGHCKSCTYREQCLPNNFKHRARFIYRNPEQEEIDRIRKQQETPAFKAKLKERQWKIEGLFAEGKGLHCLSRAKYRGLEKFQIQCYMVAIVQNIKRVLKAFLIFIYFFNRPY